MESISDVAVVRTDIGHFLDGAKKFFTVSIYRINKDIERVNDELSSEKDISAESKYVKKELYKIYEPDEVVRRAKSKLGKGNYNLIFNNCEHYAMWCKTGKKNVVRYLLNFIESIVM